MGLYHIEEMAGLDRLIHDPARLAIMTALSASSHVDFLFLQRLTGLTKGNLSNHLTKLETAGLVQIKKAFVGKVSRTTIQATEQGLAAVTEHWQHLERLQKDVQTWQVDQQENGQEPG